jgi:hypothetical protein
MISLNGVKKNLRENYPSVYQSVYLFYQMAPHVKHRNAKHAEMDKDIRAKTYARCEYEVRIIKEYLNEAKGRAESECAYCHMAGAKKDQVWTQFYRLLDK